jgi:hypothetical protein
VAGWGIGGEGSRGSGKECPGDAHGSHNVTNRQQARYKFITEMAGLQAFLLDKRSNGQAPILRCGFRSSSETTRKFSIVCQTWE